MPPCGVPLYVPWYFQFSTYPALVIFPMTFRNFSSSIFFFNSPINLLSAPLMIPLLYCQIKSFQRATRWGEAMARRRKEERWVGLATRVI